jgi:hypothetical protein
MGQESGQVEAAAATEETVNDGNEETTREHAGNEQSNRVPVHTERRGIEAAVSGGMGGDHELSTGQRADEEELEPTVEAAADEAEETVETERAGISGGAADGTPPHATDERQRRAQSETPSIKSPHKPIKGGGAARRLSRNQGMTVEEEEQQREAVGPSSRAALETIGEETSEVEETTTQDTTSTRKKSGQGSDRRGRPPRKRKGGYLDRLRPVMETMLGHLEYTLMTRMEEIPGKLNDEEHDDAACPAITMMAMNKQDLFARH